MGELIDAMLKNTAKKNKEAQEPVKDSAVLSYVQRRADEIFSRSKDGAVPSYFDIEVREYNMQSLIKAINNPVSRRSITPNSCEYSRMIPALYA